MYLNCIFLIFLLLMRIGLSSCKHGKLDVNTHQLNRMSHKNLTSLEKISSSNSESRDWGSRSINTKLLKFNVGQTMAVGDASYLNMGEKIEVTSDDGFDDNGIYQRRYKLITVEKLQITELFSINNGVVLDGIYTPYRPSKNMTMFSDSVPGKCKAKRSSGSTYEFMCTMKVAITYLDGALQNILVHATTYQIVESNHIFQALGLTERDSLLNYYGFPIVADRDTFFFQNIKKIKGLISDQETWLYALQEIKQMYPDRAYICNNRSEEMTCGYVRKLDEECGDIYMRTKCYWFMQRFTSIPDAHDRLKAFPIFPTANLRTDVMYFQTSINTTAPISLDIGNIRDIFKAVIKEEQANGDLKSTNMYDRIEGGNFAIIRAALDKQKLVDLGITEPKYERVISKVKLEQNSMTITTFPRINITAASVMKIVSARKLQTFFDLEFPKTTLFSFEKIIILPDNKECIQLKHAETYVFIENKFNITNTKFEYCHHMGVLTFRSYNNKEHNFNASTVLAISAGKTGTKDTQIYNGKVKIFSINYLQKSTGCNATSYFYQQHFSNLLQFPLKNTQYTYTHGRNYLRFYGDALVNSITFDLQVVYNFGRLVPATAMALNKEPRNDGTQNEPLILIDFMRYLFGTRKLNIESLVSFDNFCICIQKYDFYDHDNLKADQELKCKDVYTRVNNQYPLDEFLQGAEMFIQGSHFYRNCDLANSSNACKFLNRTGRYSEQFRDRSVYYGYITPMMFKMNVTLDATVHLSDTIQMTAMEKMPLSHVLEFNLLLKRLNDAANIMLSLLDDMMDITDTSDPVATSRSQKSRSHTITDLSDVDPDYESIFNKATGCLVINDQTDKRCLLGQLRFVHDSIFLEVPEINDPDPSVGFLGIADINEYIIRARPYEINATEELEYIVFNSDLKIGSKTDQEIIMNGKVGLTEQHMYADKTKNRFFMCKPISDTIDIQEFFNAFDMAVTTANIPLLNGMLIKENCFTYTNDLRWNVKSEGIIALQGLWLHGKTVLSSISEDGTATNYTVELHIKFDGEAKRMRLELPPIRLLEIPPTEDAGAAEENENADVTKKIVKKFKISILATNITQDIGPILEIDFLGGIIDKAKIKGYIKTVGFEGYVDFTLPSDLSKMAFDRIVHEAVIINKRMETPDIPKRQENQTEERDIFFSEGYHLEGLLSKDDNFAASHFKFRFDASAMLDDIRKSYLKTVNERLSFMNAKIVNATEMVNILKTRIPYTKPVNCSSINTAYNTLVQSKRNHQNIRDGINKKCIQECKMMFTPGFKWNKRCHLSKRKTNVTCLSFKKDALLSANMKCIANCEVNRVKAYERSKITRREVQENANTFEEVSQEKRIFCDLDEIVSTYQTAINTIIDNTMQPSYTYITDNVQAKPITVIALSTPLTDFSVYTKPLNVTFDIKYKHVDNTVRDETLTIQADAALAQRVANHYLDKEYKSKFEEFNVFMEEVVKKYEEGVEIISNWEFKNKDFLKIYSRKYTYIPASHKRTVKYLNNFNIDQPSQYSNDEPHRLKQVIKGYAPWNVLQQENPFKTNTTFNNALRKSPITQVRSACANTRNKLAEYKDMIQYMKSWSTAYDEARNMADIWKVNINKGLSHFTTKSRKRTVNNNTKHNAVKEDIESKWKNKLKAGFASWETEFNKQLYSLYAFGPRMMKNEMNAIFTPQGYKDFDNFIQSSAKPLDDGYTRSMNSNDKPFLQISRYLLNGINGMRNIDDNKNVVDGMQHMIDNMERTETSCHDEL